MTKVDIFSGFLGAGKTTLIKKLIEEAYRGEKLVLIENEFGEIGVDGMFMQEAGIEVTEMNSGCICCSLVGDFGKALKEVLTRFSPDRILVEPSGVGKLSDVILAVQNVDSSLIKLNGLTTVVDAKKSKMYMKNFGEFFNNQVEYANCIILSRTEELPEEKIAQCISMLREYNQEATIISTPWNQLEGKQILEAIEQRNTLKTELEILSQQTKMHDKHKHREGGCGHEHHHEHGECCCGHEHHHAEDVFTSWGTETARVFSREALEQALTALNDSAAYGLILRAKGALASKDGQWLYFDYVPEETNIRIGKPSVIGRLCVIGTRIDEQKLKTLFGVI